MKTNAKISVTLIFLIYLDHSGLTRALHDDITTVCTWHISTINSIKVELVHQCSREIMIITSIYARNSSTTLY